VRLEFELLVSRLAENHAIRNVSIVQVTRTNRSVLCPIGPHSNGGEEAGGKHVSVFMRRSDSYLGLTVEDEMPPQTMDEVLMHLEEIVGCEMVISCGIHGLVLDLNLALLR
jgi:hypothetical protein